jgi:transposase
VGCEAVSASAKGGGRKLAVSDEAALNGILFVLQTGIPWEDLPQSLGYGAGMTCWRRPRGWNTAGVWEQLHQALLPHMRERDQIHLSQASIGGPLMPLPWRAGNGAQPDAEAGSAPGDVSL